MKRLLVISTLLILTACAAPVTATSIPSATTAPTAAIPSNTPPPTVTPTNTATPTITATLTPIVGPSPTPSLTPTLASWIEEEFLFGGPASEKCELPCWQGLTPGVSTAEEVDQVFTQIFGYGRDYDSVESVAATYAAGDLPLMHWAGQSWLYETDTSPLETGSDIFSATAFLDRETYLLGAIQFRWSGLLLHYTPAMLIREFGQPSHFFVGVIRPGRGIPPWYTSFILVYDELGITFSSDIHFSSGEICLDGFFWTGQYDKTDRYLILTPPITEEMLTQEQVYLLDITSPAFYSPFEDKFGVSLEEVTQQIQSGGIPCWLYHWDWD